MRRSGDESNRSTLPHTTLPDELTD